jgi:peptide/nickel transport system substrate-binding protein
MSDRAYWTKILSARVSRRRAIVGGSVVGASLAALSAVGCSGKGSNQQIPTDVSSLVARPQVSTDKAKPGGTLQLQVAVDPRTFDSSGGGANANLYLTFLKNTLGTPDKPADGSVQPNFFQSYELTDDGLQLTLKTRPNVKFDERAPTNGRVADAEDAAFSWNRWVNKTGQGVILANSKNKSSPVISVSAVDKQTLVMKLAFPFAPLLQYLALNGNSPVVFPKETDSGGFDPGNDARGNFWLLGDVKSSVSYTYKRNPGYYEEGRPFYDAIQFNVIPEYATGLSQFKAGNLDWFGVRPDDILSVKSENPNLILLQRPVWTKSTLGWTNFGQLPGSPFFDDRVRKAFSLSIDRDTWLDALSNKQKFAAAGVTVETTYYGFVGPNWPFFLDPRGSEIGEGGQWFKYDPAEAKKLLRAAGHTSPIIAPWQADAVMPTYLEAVRAQVESLGDFKMPIAPHPEYASMYLYFHEHPGNYEGVGNSWWVDQPDADYELSNTVHSAGGDYYLKTGYPNGIPEYDRLIERERQELDPDKRAELFKAIQKEMARQLHYLPGVPGEWKDFSLVQPWLGNWGALQGWRLNINPFPCGTSPWLDDISAYLWDSRRA